MYKFVCVGGILRRLTLVPCLMVMSVSLIRGEASVPSIQPSDKYQLSFTGGKLSLEAKEASVSKIIQDIGTRAGIIVRGSFNEGETASLRLTQQPIEEAIKQLAKNVAIVYTKKPGEASSRVSEVILLHGGFKPIAQVTPEQTLSLPPEAPPPPPPPPPQPPGSPEL